MKAPRDQGGGRESQLWEDPPEYYAPSKGLLVYAPRVRRELIRKAGVMDVASHFELVHHQLAQMRNAFALAQKLDRILILPRLICGLDRWWAPHSGIVSSPPSTPRPPRQPRLIH